MDVYEYLVEVVKQVEGGWELPLNKEVSLSKDSSGIVELVIFSDWVDCAIPIKSIRSEENKVIVNDEISMEITYDNFLEIDLESESREVNHVSVEFIAKLIQDGKINFRVSSKAGNTIYFYDDHTVKYGLFDFGLSNSKVCHLRTRCDGMEFDLGKGMKLLIPKDAKIIIDPDD